MTTMTKDELEVALAKRPYPRVTENSIKDKIASVEYQLVGDGTAVICIITMSTGWVSTGFSAPADPRNFDRVVGEHYSFEKAFEPLWQLEGYLLKNKLFDRAEGEDGGQ